jgi:hypothetical protein
VIVSSQRWDIQGGNNARSIGAFMHLAEQAANSLAVAQEFLECLDVGCVSVTEEDDTAAKLRAPVELQRVKVPAQSE